MITVMLYGFLGKQFGKVHRYHVKSVAEAVRALSATLPGFRKALIDGGAYRVLRAGKTEVTLDNLSDPHSQYESIRIVPVVSGAGKGLGSLIIGAALIATGMGMTQGLSMLGALTAEGGVVWGSVVGNAMVSVGTSLVMGGVSELLFSAEPTSNTGSTDNPTVENQPSYGFSGTTNTVSQGNPVPVCYGRMIVGSQVISAGLRATSI